MSCDQERFDDGARVTDGKGARIVFHFAGVDDRVMVLDDVWAYESSKKTDIAKWQIFWVDGRIRHIVNMDNVTFVEVVEDD